MSNEQPKTVCDDQKTFNKALQKAAFYTEKKQTPSLWFQMMWLGVFVIILTYALLLASKTTDKNDKVLHFVLALACAPIYVLSHMITDWSNK